MGAGTLTVVPIMGRDVVPMGKLDQSIGPFEPWRIDDGHFMPREETFEPVWARKSIRRQMR